MPELTDAEAYNIIRYLRGLEGIETRGNKTTYSNQSQSVYTTIKHIIIQSIIHTFISSLGTILKYFHDLLLNKCALQVYKHFLLIRGVEMKVTL